MGLRKRIDNWILKKAKALEKVAEESKKERIIKFDAKRKREKEIESDIREAIIESLEPIEQKMLQTGFHIKKGQRCIFNRYSIDFDSRNSWDNGAFAIIHQEEFRDDRLIYATIKNVDIAWDLVDEKIDNFLENTDAVYRIDKFPEEIKSIARRFKDRVILMTRSNSIFEGNFGLYPRASFEIEDSTFKPNWGLLAYSFLDIDSPGGKLTEKLWTLKYNLSVSKKKVSEFEKTYNIEKEVSIKRHNLKVGQWDKL